MMMSFAQTVLFTPVPQNRIAVFFLGQAGFVFKDRSGRLLALDPYLSDSCSRLVGYKRLMARLMDPDDLHFDVIAVSHAHPDHFDTDAIPLLMNPPDTRLVCAEDCRQGCGQLRLSERTAFLRVGDRFETDGMVIHAVPCDHGAQTPDALGFLIEMSGKRIYFMGDTSYRPDFLENEALHRVDLLLLPINGAFGNLNEEEAARVCGTLCPSLAVPCHYWNFAEHLGNPYLYMQEMRRLAPDVKYTVMRQGEGTLI